MACRPYSTYSTYSKEPGDCGGSAAWRVDPYSTYSTYSRARRLWGFSGLAYTPHRAANRVVRVVRSGRQNPPLWTTLALSLEGVFQMDSILPERLLALVRPAFDLVLRRIRSLKRCAGVRLQNRDPKICAAIWLQVAFQARSSFAKRNPFSIFFGDPFFWDPLFSFFFCFFLALQRLACLKCNLEPNCKHI